MNNKMNDSGLKNDYRNKFVRAFWQKHPPLRYPPHRGQR